MSPDPTVGIQVAGLWSRGYRDVNQGAGQGGGYGTWAYVAGFLLGDSGVLEAGQVQSNNLHGAGPRWLSEVRLGTTPKITSEDGRLIYQPILDGMLGHPFNMPDGFGTNVDTRYGDIGTSNAMWDALAIAPLMNGPGGITGWEAICDGPYNETNDRAAMVAHLSVYRQRNPDVAWSYGKESMWNGLYDVVIGAIGPGSDADRPFIPWTGTPEQLPQERRRATYNDQYFTAIDGGVSFDISNYDWSTEPRTGVDVRYSLDGVQWHLKTGLQDDDSVEGLSRGIEHWFGIRQVSASGAGAWSTSHPPALTGEGAAVAIRGLRTPTGTPSPAAPVFTVDPEIAVIRYPEWTAWDEWMPAPSTLEFRQRRLAAGVGYYTGHPAPSAAYQWLRNGSPISGATEKEYVFDNDDIGEALSCDVTLTNEHGSVTKRSSSVTVLALPAVPAGVLIDTDFTDFDLVYAAEWAILDTRNCAVEMMPFEDYGTYTSRDEQEPLSPGLFAMKKNGSIPRARFTLSRPAEGGATYRVEAQQFTGLAYRPGVYSVKKDADVFLEIEAGGNVVWGKVNDSRDSRDGIYTWRYGDTFVVPGDGPVTLTVSTRTHTGSGLHQGNNASLSYLKITKIDD